ncbi:MAG: AmmeMemoRadiSam system protein B [Thaumarchaeota archaeon]|nr:AmmeMemoRadiSam system protein B [Nitrososphaerota archaeon]
MINIWRVLVRTGDQVLTRRMPVVAGMFYSSSKGSLEKEIEAAFLHELGPGKLPQHREAERAPPALIAPHAGYMYSGPIAAHSYIQLDGRRKPETVIILGPNHYGIGTPVSIYPEGSWVTPLGEVEIDRDLAFELAESSDVFSLDELSHQREHSIEVQVPFLQYVLGEVKIVPICMLDQSLGAAVKVGEALAKVLERHENVTLVASSDFTHYEPHEEALRKDEIALDRIRELDVNGLYEVIGKYDISMCGYGAVAAVLHACKKLGAKKAEVLKHATSGDVTGDYGSVVGYAAVKVEFRA